MTKAQIKRIAKIGERIETARAAIYSYGNHNMTLNQCRSCAPAELVKQYDDAWYEYDKATGAA